jgi:hypothetical protein
MAAGHKSDRRRSGNARPGSGRYGTPKAATTSQEFASFVASEQKKWAAVAKRANIRIED